MLWNALKEIRAQKVRTERNKAGEQGSSQRHRKAEGETQSLIYQFNESGNDRNNCGAASPLKSIAWRFMAH